MGLGESQDSLHPEKIWSFSIFKDQTKTQGPPSLIQFGGEVVKAFIPKAQSKWIGLGGTGEGERVLENSTLYLWDYEPNGLMYLKKPLAVWLAGAAIFSGGDLASLDSALLTETARNGESPIDSSRSISWAL